MREAFTRDLRAGTRGGLIAAARRAYAVALLALLVPGGVFVALVLASPPPAVPTAAALVLYGVGVALAAWALRRAGQVAAQDGVPARQSALTAAMQAATAPGVVFLLGCTVAHQPPLLAGFWVTAALLHAHVWTRVPAWVRDPQRSPEVGGAGV